MEALRQQTPHLSGNLTVKREKEARAAPDATVNGG